MKIFPLSEVKHLKFRLTTTEDIEKIIVLEQLNKEFVGQWSFDQHQAALTNKDIAHIIFYSKSQDFIGFAVLKGLTNSNKNIELMRIVINAPGNGYGKKAISLLLDWCFNELDSHRVWLDVRIHNLRAQKVYADIGFVKEGLLRDCILFKDRYESLLVMSILKDEYK